MSTRLRDYYGEGQLVGPRDDVRVRLVLEARRFVLTKFPAGVSRSGHEAEEVVGCFFGFLLTRLKSVLRKVGSAEFMQFVLYQYDVAAREWRSGRLGTGGGNASSSSGLSALRRGLKFLAESTTLMSAVPERAPAGGPNLFRYVEEALLAAELLAEVYMLKDRIHYTFLGEAGVDFGGREAIGSEGEEPALFRLVGIEGLQEADLRFTARLERDSTGCQRVFPEGPLTSNFNEQALILDPAFEASFGYPFSKFLHVLAAVLEDIRPAPGGYPVVFCPVESLIRGIVAGGLCPNAKAIRIILDGFTISRKRMREEQRAIFRPKQEYRALRRGYFEFPRHGAAHLAWSAALAQEAFDHLLGGLCFKKIPSEWVTPATTAAVEELSNRAGRWFEREVAAKLQSLGICGEGVGGRVIGGGEKLGIPSDVGQFDFLGYSEKDSALVVVESKMVEVGYEPRFFRDEISQFATGKRSYAAQLRKKLDWVAANRAALGRVFGAGTGEPRVVSALITLHPTYAAFKIADMPCVSVVELMEDYQAASAWPYAVGIR